MDSVLAIIPISGADYESAGRLPELNGVGLLDYTFDAARVAKTLTRTIVVTDSSMVADYAKSRGMDVPFLRPIELRTRPVIEVLRYATRTIAEAEGSEPDWVVQLQVTHPLRPSGFVDDAVRTVLGSDLDSAFAASEEFSSFWMLGDTGRPERLVSSHRAAAGTRQPVYRELSGLFSMARAAIVSAGSMVGDNLGIIPIRDRTFLLDVQESLR
ncbi:MAG TPA: hypothetical protein VGM67_02580 [Gemmatimonadaceae bacterium]|jgi:CMP-N-acetylneuraminic acid synthetase